MTATWIVAALVLSAIPAWLASRKGHPFGRWYLLGILLSPVISLPMALLVKRDRNRQRRCPHCTSWVSTAATVCPDCHSTLEPIPAAVAAVRQENERVMRLITGIAIAGAAVLIGVIMVVLATGGSA